MKRGDFVQVIVGNPGPDLDIAIYLRRENDTHVVWMGGRGDGPYNETTFGTVFPVTPAIYIPTPLITERYRLMAKAS